LPSPAGQAAASAGEMRRYAAEVRAALARNKPSGRGRHGVTTVTFTISTEGKLSTTRIHRSSGNALLDRDALVAVERTAFPKPHRRS